MFSYIAELVVLVEFLASYKCIIKAMLTGKINVMYRKPFVVLTGYWLSTTLYYCHRQLYKYLVRQLAGI